MMNSIARTMQRKSAIATASPERHTALRKGAEALSRRNVDAAVAELLNDALMAAVGLAYEKNSDGTPANVDPVTMRVLFPLPWGRAGCAKWGLSRQEGNFLRKVMFDRQDGPGVFLYDRSRRSWFLNVSDFPQKRLALAYVESCPLTVAEYRAARSACIDRA